MCLAVALLAVADPALAHVALEYPPATPAPAPLLDAQILSAAAPTLTGLWTLVAAVAIGGVLVARRRTAVALACVALLTVIAFEAGLHSVHHIGDQPDGSCVIASASAHTGALTVDSPALERPAEVTTPVVVRVDAPTSARSAAPDLGRAPPAA